MTRFIKNRLILTSLLIISVFLGTFNEVLAYTPQTGDDYYVEFTNSKKMKDNFNNSDGITEKFGNMEPGDDITFQVKVINSYKTDTEWYMTNKVLKSLEENHQVASAGGYSYILTYTNPDGDVSTIYNSEKVGGEAYTPKRPGLKEATQAMEDYFKLDTIKPGEIGYVKLRVLLDGESQGNDYQDTLAKLQMNFAVELPAENEDKIWSSENKIKENINNFFKASFVKTSDNTNIILLYIIVGIIGILLIVVGIICIRIRKKMKGADEEWEE